MGVRSAANKIASRTGIRKDAARCITVRIIAMQARIMTDFKIEGSLPGIQLIL
jgi:hypothetical protein